MQNGFSSTSITEVPPQTEILKLNNLAYCAEYRIAGKFGGENVW